MKRAGILLLNLLIILGLILVGCGGKETTKGSNNTQDSQNIENTQNTNGTNSTQGTTSSTPPSETIHTHVWNEATCISPKTCSLCGETEGSVSNEHHYDGVICTECDYIKESAGIAIEWMDNQYTIVENGVCTETELVLPSSYKGFPVTAIGINAFASSDTLTKLIIPDTITEISFSAFSGCSTLTDIEFSNNILYFYPNYENLPDNLNYTEYNDAYYLGNSSNPYLILVKNTGSICQVHPKTRIVCAKAISQSIQDIILSEQTIRMHDRYEYRQNVYTRYGNCYYLGTEDNPYHYLDHIEKDCEEYEIHPNTKVIGDFAFWLFDNSGSSGLLELSQIPEGVISIGNHAFPGCGFKTLDIPDSVKYIGDNAFIDCIWLTNVEIPESVVRIGVNPFKGCTALTSISVSNSNLFFYDEENCLISKISETLISGTNNSQIPSKGISHIGDYAFYYCQSLTNAYIPTGVTHIGNYAFSQCSELKHISLPDGLVYFGNNSFSYTKCESIEIPNSASYIGDETFIFTRLSSIYIPKNITYIGTRCFSFTALTEVIFAEDSLLKELNCSAFEYCYDLTKVELPEAISDLSTHDFYDCRNLVYNQYGDANYLGSKSNPYLVLIGPTDPEITDCNIHPNTRVIASYAFTECVNLTSVNIPESVTCISACAFNGCTSLQQVTIEEGVAEIQASAFRDCTALESITLPSTISVLENGSFSGCKNLTTVIFNGTTAQWKNFPKKTIALGKLTTWLGCKAKEVICADGTIDIDAVE